MKITDFIANYKNKKFMNAQRGVDERVEYLKKELEIKTYIPFADKRELCELVIETCCSKEDDGLIKVDSVARYIAFTISVIKKYTNLEFSSGEEDGYDSLDEYDMLCENGLLNLILAIIGDEYATCNNILNMMMEDTIANNNTVEAVIGRALDKVGLSLDVLMATLAQKVEEMELDLSQIDIDKYKGILDLLPQK